jgi:hypothetical protein
MRSAVLFALVASRPETGEFPAARAARQALPRGSNRPRLPQAAGLTHCRMKASSILKGRENSLAVTARTIRSRNAIGRGRSADKTQALACRR